MWPELTYMLADLFNWYLKEIPNLVFQIVADNQTDSLLPVLYLAISWQLLSIDQFYRDSILNGIISQIFRQIINLQHRIRHLQHLIVHCFVLGKTESDHKKKKKATIWVFWDSLHYQPLKALKGSQKIVWNPTNVFYLFH